PSFQFDPNSNMLLVTASDDMHERAAKLITELDQPGPNDSVQPRPIQLIHADAEYVEDMIEDLLEDDSGRGRGYSPYYSRGYGGSDNPNKIQVRVVAEPVTNRVFVTASDDDFKRAEELAKQIDEEYVKKEVERRTFVLERADPTEAGPGRRSSPRT
ncbi:hypothetical protein FBQ97_09045, partial [Acidobacteria bacterium ACD]|nr:hypothetical protein [Acidobacteria bacterium ACD]